jgi:hypothetical protein
MAAMKQGKPWGWLAGTMVAIGLTACSSSTLPPPVQYSPVPSTLTLPGKLVVVNHPLRIGDNLVLAGTGFSPDETTTAALLQGGKTAVTVGPGVVAVHKGGRLSATFTIPKTMQPGIAELLVCAYRPGTTKVVGCVSINLLLVR